MLGSGGGVWATCTSTCSPTPRPRRPFQRATSRSRLPQLPASLPLAEQPLGKIYSFRQFRHFSAQLVHALDQLRLLLRGSGSLTRHGTVLESLRERLSHRRERNHPGKEATHGDDRNEQRQNVFHQPPFGLASNRSAKSIRSASSATSCRTACSSLRISSRSAGSSPGLRCSPAMRLATAAATGRSTQKVPPKNMNAATASGPFMSGTFWRAAAQ